MCLRGHCIPTNPWFEGGVRREVCSSLDGGQEGDYQEDMPSTAVTCAVLALSPLTDPGDLGAGICTFATCFSPAANGRGDGRHCGALCVCRAVGGSPCGADAGASHSPTHRGWQGASPRSTLLCCGISSIHVLGS